jgi:hypothetical protein
MPTKATFGTYIFDLRQAIKKINGLRQCFLKQFFAEITISALLWGGFAAP